MNVVFMGTPAFALPTLELLARRFDLRAVFSRPDAVSRRGKTPQPSAVKARALELGIPVFSPQSFFVSSQDGQPLFDTRGQRVLDAEVLAAILSAHPDVIVVAAYGQILPAAVLALPAAGCVNLHASLLPRWRGAAPIQRAILAGDESLGVSVMRMEAGLDTGPYCAQVATPALSKNYQELVLELAELGGQLICATLPAIVAGSAQWTAQDERLVTYANKVEKGSIDLDPALTQAENINRVRAASRHVRCRAVLHGRPVSILAARPAAATPATGLYWPCADGALEITELQPDGGRIMSGQAFQAGYAQRN